MPPKHRYRKSGKTFWQSVGRKVERKVGEEGTIALYYNIKILIQGRKPGFFSSPWCACGFLTILASPDLTR